MKVAEKLKDSKSRSFSVFHSKYGFCCTVYAIKIGKNKSDGIVAKIEGQFVR